MDCRDHRPDLNARLCVLMASGIGLRQTSRTLGLSLRCTELQFREGARHLRRLNLNLRRKLDGEVSFHFDELETYEGQRNTCPLRLKGATELVETARVVASGARFSEGPIGAT